MDAKDGKVLGSGATGYDLIPNLAPGAKEQHPHSWVEATASAIRQALRQAKAVAAEVVASAVRWPALAPGVMVYQANGWR